jgi:predicted negative regulator of RcsB-dependent stress response
MSFAKILFYKALVSPINFDRNNDKEQPMPLLISFFAIFLYIQPLKAAEMSCAAIDRSCLLEELEGLTSAIEEDKWRDQTYRELAKLLAQEKQTDQAISVIEKIENPDTKAMTIRGIGMAASNHDYTQNELATLFEALRLEADKIEHPPSYAIALTYIAMAQAFAGDDNGAMKTANDMKNNALRNKAFGEAAEIQAENGRFEEAMKSIKAIEDPAFKNKAYRTISKIFTDNQNYDAALKAAMTIDNTYQKAQSVLYILAKQITPTEVSLVE